MRQIDFDLQKKANQFRNDAGIGLKEPIPFKAIFLKLGIICVYKDLSGKFSGMSIKVGENMFILINSCHPIGRQNFTICHEFYHLFMEEHFQSHRCIAGEFNKQNKTEYNADRFASYLLMPEDGLLELIPDAELKRKNLITLTSFLRLEQYYSCSRTALLYRLSSLGLIDVDKYEEYKNNVSKEAIKHGYDASIYLPGNKDLVFGDYGEIANKLFDNEKISESHYAQLMLDIGIDIDMDLTNHDRS